MGNITITVPREHAGVFRMNAFALYESRADGLLVSVNGYRERKSTSADVLVERDRLDGVEPILDQIDWEDRGHENEELEIAGRRDVLQQIVAGCVHDAGHQVADFCQRLDVDHADIAAWTRQVDWFAQKRDELGSEGGA